MSQLVPYVDLSLYAVGQNGQLQLSSTLAKVPVNPAINPIDNPMHIRIYNDSGSTLQIHDDNGTISDYVPAGAWPTYTLDPNSFTIYFSVVSILPNPPIQLLMATIYGPGETVPDTPQLGNSPVGIGGTVKTSGVQTLSNEGAISTTLVIDMGDVNFADLVQMFAGGQMVWAVDQSGVKHAVIKVNAAGNPIQLGQAGDTVEILGELTIDQLLNASLGASIVGGATTDTLDVTSTSVFQGEATFNSDVKTNTIRDNVSGLDQVDLAAAGATFNNLSKHSGGIQLGSGGTGDFIECGETGNNKILDATSGTDMYFNPPASGTGHAVHFATNATERGGFNDDGCFSKGSHGFIFPTGQYLPNISFFTGTGSGTYNHGYGSAPYWVCPIVQVSGSATQGYNSVTSTQVHVTLGASLSFKAFCG